MITPIAFTRLRNDEFIQFIRDVLKIIETINPEALQLLIQYHNLYEMIVDAEKAYLLTRGSELTKEITEKDNRRDDDVIGLKLVAEGYSRHYEAEKAEAAELLLSHFKKYGGNIAGMNYQAETTAINDLVDNVENDPKLSAAVALLGLPEWFVGLKASNAAFNDVYMMRIGEQAEKPSGNLRELRAQCIEAYTELTKHLTARATISPSDLYEKAVNMINELIDKYNTLRRKRKSNGNDAPEEPPAE